MDIYAPLAERIGMHNFKDQLEDLAFAQLNEDARESMVTRLNFLEEQGENLTSKVIDELTRVLAEDGVEAWVSGRIKTPYSVWRKMQRKNVTFEQLSDIVAFRVVVKDVQDCYRALGVLHSRFPVVPGRFKDYVSTPKPNGYKSIHTGLIGPSKQRVEVQIRTSEMHEQAEYGVAAHWIYKQTEKDGGQEGKQYRWLRELLDILDQTANPEEFLEHTKMEMFQDQVFCFSPEIGDRCVGARVNGRMVPLRTPLENGDQVEIITSKAQTPSPDWENFVVSGKAKARVRRFVRLREREQYAELGRNMLEKQFRQEGYDLTEKALQGVIKKFKIDHVVDLHSAVGQGVLTAREVLYAVYPGAREQDKAQKIVPIARARAKAKGKGRQDAVPIKGLIPGMALHFAHCCHPLPGDRIVGIVTTGKGVTVHTIDCETLESFQSTPERWVDLSWDTNGEVESFTGRLQVVLANEPGSLGALSTLIGRSEGNISNLKITNRSTDFFEMLVDVQVEDLKHLSNIIAALRASPVITSVERRRG